MRVDCPTERLLCILLTHIPRVEVVLPIQGIEELGLAKITAGVYETNIGSAKALEKAGFKLEATIPSHVICDGQRIASQLYGLDAQQLPKT